MSASRATSGGLGAGRVALELALLAAVLLGINYLASRHYLRGDLTRGQTFSLSDKTISILRGLTAPVEVIVFMIPSGPGANDLYSDTHELLERAARYTPYLKVDYVDIDRDPERLRAAAKRYKLDRDDIENGVMVVESGSQSKFVVRSELADYDSGDEGPPRLIAWKGEQALMSAILTVTEAHAPVLCFTQGHGEPAIDSLEPGAFGDFAEMLRRDHNRVQAIELSIDIPTDCNLVVMSSPEQPYAPAETKRLDALLDRGGRLWALLGPSVDAKIEHFAPTGLEDFFSHHGVALGENVVVDTPNLPGSPTDFFVSEGYGEHPITSRLMHHRTLWTLSRQVRAVPLPGGEALEIVHSSDDGWGETDLALLRIPPSLSFDSKRDVKGPISLAVAARKKLGESRKHSDEARWVVLGSSEMAASRVALSYNRDLLLGTVAWLCDVGPKIAMGPREPEDFRLSLDATQTRRIFLVCVLALPLFALFFGLGIYWVRRS